MKAIAFPRLPAIRLHSLSQALEVEPGPLGEFNGKRLQVTRHLIPVPRGRRWRALFVQTASGHKSRDCLTHERYNKLNFAAEQV